MGILNRNGKNLKVVITENGKKALLEGKFNIGFYQLYDDEIIYTLNNNPSIGVDITGKKVQSTLTKGNNIKYLY